MNELPKGWSISTISNVAETIFGQSPPSSSYNTEGVGLPFFQGKAEFGERHPVARKWCNTPTRVAAQGDILISIRAPVGPTNVASENCGIGRGLAAIRSKIEPAYVLHWLRLSQRTLEEKGTGTTFSAISKNVLNSHKIPVAPLNEQRRIVEKIETLFTRLDKGEESLRAAQKLLARYRQSVLKAAVTGELTADWRAENAHRLERGRDLLVRILKTRRENWSGRGRYKEPVAPDTADLPELPESWIWASLSQLTRIAGGVTVDKKREARNSMTLPYLRVANVQLGRIDLTEVKEITVDRARAEQCFLEPGDILLNEGGDRDKLGRGWVWDGQISPCIHQNHVFRARPVIAELSSRLISYYSNAFGQQFFMQKGKQSVNLASISLTAISGLPVPLPPIEEQEEIVIVLEKKLTEVEAMESWCETELSRSSSLRQSILKDAFSGRLVDQDPNDEPACELLARIKSAHTSTKKIKRGKASA